MHASGRYALEARLLAREPLKIGALEYITCSIESAQYAQCAQPLPRHRHRRGGCNTCCRLNGQKQNELITTVHVDNLGVVL